MFINDPIEIRPIQPADVPALRTILALGGVELLEPAERALYSNYQRSRALYVVAVRHGELVGGAGVVPFAGADPLTCELQRLIVRPGARRRGIGEALLRHCVAAARQFLYVRCCFETGVRGQAARRFYARHGFRELPEHGDWIMRPLRASARGWLDGVPVRPSFDGVTACALLGAGAQ
jgi:ribosomal protein S18 acetylase RimI-like enzyme